MADNNVIIGKYYPFVIKGLSWGFKYWIMYRIGNSESRTQWNVAINGERYLCYEFLIKGCYIIFIKISRQRPTFDAVAVTRATQVRTISQPQARAQKGVSLPHWWCGDPRSLLLRENYVRERGQFHCSWRMHKKVKDVAASLVMWEPAKCTLLFAKVHFDVIHENMGRKPAELSYLNR